MKQETFEHLKKSADIMSAFGDAKNASQIKQYAKITSVLNKIENTTQEAAIIQVLNFYRPIFAELPKDIRGIAKKKFCNAIRTVCNSFGTLFLFDNNGNVCAPRAVAKLRKSDNAELFQLLGNLLANSEAVNANIEAIEAKEAKEAENIVKDIKKAA